MTGACPLRHIEDFEGAATSRSATSRGSARPPRASHGPGAARGGAASGPACHGRGARSTSGARASRRGRGLPRPGRGPAQRRGQPQRGTAAPAGREGAPAVRIGGLPAPPRHSRSRSAWGVRRFFVRRAREAGHSGGPGPLAPDHTTGPTVVVAGAARSVCARRPPPEPSRASHGHDGHAPCPRIVPLARQLWARWTRWTQPGEGTPMQRGREPDRPPLPFMRALF